MLIKLIPFLGETDLCVLKSGSTLTINGELFDFSPLGDGDTLPYLATPDEYFFGDVDKVDGEIILTLRLPLRSGNYSPEQAFPVDITNVPDGRVALPRSLPDADGAYPELPPVPETKGAGVVDWTQLITKAMKDAAGQATQLVAAKAELAGKNAKAVSQIARIQDRIDTLGYGIDAGEATEEDEAEQAALMLNLRAWKTYKFALGKVTVQPTWYAAPVWPLEPAVPIIVADPQTLDVDLM